MKDSTTQQAMHAAMQHHQAGRLAEAEALYRQVLERAPQHADALNLLGLLAHQVGRHEAAMELIGRAILVNNSNPDFHSNLGIVYQATNRLDEAVASYRRAIRLAPDFALAHCNLGRALNAQGKQDDAVASYRKALALRPDLAEAQSNLGNVLTEQGKLDAAISCYQKALALKPDLAEAHGNLGNACNRLGRLDEAMAAFQKALALKPNYAGAYAKMGNAWLFAGRPDLAVDCLQKALAIKPDDAEVYSELLFTLLYRQDCSPAELLAAHRRYAERFEVPRKLDWQTPTNTRIAERRLKVGYVSPNFRRHSVAMFIEPVLAHHDKDQVEIYCYYNHPRLDDVSARIADYADHWLHCTGWPDGKLAERIRADGIDILVDLAGHTRDNSLLTFARKPAPLQLSYLGYPATTGLSAMDYRLSHSDVDSPGCEAHYSESLYRLPHTLWCFRPSPDSPEPADSTPARRQGYITFGSMNSFSKVSAAALGLWIAILQALPRSRLVMTRVPEGAVRRALQERFAAQGIDPDRLSLHGRLPAREFYALLKGIDITLDPFPYNGTTTTCESLWMGIPVVTLIGETSVARSGYALLKGIGLEELAARDEKEYVAIATALATDLERLDALRGGMRQRIASSPLRDEAGLTRDLEAAYRAMWRRWCAP